MQQTSMDAYRQMKKSGTLGHLQEQVYMAIVNNPRVTDREIAAIISLEINSVTGRRNELADMGLIQSVGKRKCDITGNLALVWSVSRPGQTTMKRGHIICPCCGK